MCGFIFISQKNSSRDLDVSLIKGSNEMIRRGPDAHGSWIDVDHGVGLSHRRLAIVDLDERSRQPMVSNCGRYIVAFNGEIYNYKKLRDFLVGRGVIFKTSSDTEVILEMYIYYGEEMLGQLHGMFAFVIWDKISCKAFAARDPYGIKPVYVGSSPDVVVLASQVKAILATQLVDDVPDLVGQAGFWMLGSVPEPKTWFKNIEALPGGYCLVIENGQVLSRRCWHDLGQTWRTADQASLEFSDRDVCNVVADALRESVDRHLVADVPVGVFLSGGIDSGALAALMIERGAKDLQGITIAYDEFSGRPEDEAPVAAQLAEYYGMRHHIRRIGRDEFLADIPRIMGDMDQPSIDGINTWYASKAVAELGLKVVVSGVGGDELFQGYQHFNSLEKFRRWHRYIGAAPGAQLVLNALGRVQYTRTRNGRWKYFSEWMQSIEGAWWLRRSVCSPDDLPYLMGEDQARSALMDFDVVSQVRAMVGEIATDTKLAIGQIESMTYMRNQLLRDSDWASMGHSVELRTPLVDVHLLTQVSACLHRFSRFPNKKLLALAPLRALPESIIGRTKTGFGIPVLGWSHELINQNRVPRSKSGWAGFVADACYKDWQ